MSGLDALYSDPARVTPESVIDELLALRPHHFREYFINVLEDGQGRRELQECSGIRARGLGSHDVHAHDLFEFIFNRVNDLLTVYARPASEYVHRLARLAKAFRAGLRIDRRASR